MTLVLLEDYQTLVTLVKTAIKEGVYNLHNTIRKAEGWCLLDNLGEIHIVPVDFDMLMNKGLETLMVDACADLDDDVKYKRNAFEPFMSIFSTENKKDDNGFAKPSIAYLMVGHANMLDPMKVILRDPNVRSVMENTISNKQDGLVTRVVYTGTNHSLEDAPKHVERFILDNYTEFIECMMFNRSMELSIPSEFTEEDIHSIVSYFERHKPRGFNRHGFGTRSYDSCVVGKRYIEFNFKFEPSGGPVGVSRNDIVVSCLLKEYKNMVSHELYNIHHTGVECFSGSFTQEVVRKLAIDEITKTYGVDKESIDITFSSSNNGEMKNDFTKVSLIIYNKEEK